MSRLSSKKKSSQTNPGIDWHDQKKPHSDKKKARPEPHKRLTSMSELARGLATVEDIEKLQILARAGDIDISSMEI